MNDAQLLTVRVIDRSVEAEGIVSFQLANSNGEHLPPVEAGAHIDVHLPHGLVRQYSLCNTPGETRVYQIAVLREEGGRGGSTYMHESVLLDSELKIGYPRNAFRLNEAASESILFAGGIGITPILAMAKRLRAIDAKFSMHYCTRSKERTAFMRSMMASDISDRLQFHFDDENEMQKLNLNACLENANPDAHLYVCGPRGFMDYVLSTARTLGWGENSLHYEFFSGDAQSSADNQPFEVVIASTGTTIRIPANKTVVAALADHGIEIPTSCEQGVCGTCITGVLEGIPLHKDQFLTPEERSRNNQFLPCCSRASTTSLKLNL